MAEYAELTAPDGGIVPGLQPSGRWAWVGLFLGAVAIVVGGVVLAHGVDRAEIESPTPQSSVVDSASHP
jgi:hypothetical protein